MEPRDRADGEIARADSEILARLAISRGASLAAELLERHAEIDDLHFRGRHLPRADHEVGRALRHRQRDVGVRLQQAVRDLLKPRRVGEVRVLVEDRRDAPKGGGHAPERRGAVAVQMQHVDLLPIDHLQERGQRERVEFRPVQVGDVHALRLERLLREVLPAEADQRHLEPVGVEPRDHPAEQALDAVHPRPFPAEVIADLQHVQRAMAHFVEKWARRRQRSRL